MNRQAGLVLSGLMLSAAPALALDAEDLLNHTWGRFGVRPQVGVTSLFTDNLFYGNDDVVQQQIYKPILGVIDLGNGPVPVFGPVTTNNLVARAQESDVVMTVSP